MIYQPMLELAAFLWASGFKTFIVSGGGIDFMRHWTEKVYVIPHEYVVGSIGKTPTWALRFCRRGTRCCSSAIGFSVSRR